MRRKNLNSISYITLVCLTLAACHRNPSSGRDLQLLTANPWKYEKAGFNSEDEDFFDALDPRIAGSEKANTLIFRADGTGSTLDSLPFAWSFHNNDSTIYFQNQYFRVETLSHSRMVLYTDQKLGGVSSRYTIVFRH